MDEEEWEAPFGCLSDPVPGQVLPFITTPYSTIEKIFTLCAIEGQNKVIDLGSGDGRIVVYAAETFGCKGIGIDIDPSLVEDARTLARERKVEHLVEFKEMNFMEDTFPSWLDEQNPTIITCYIIPKILKQIETPLKRIIRTQSCTRVVSIGFPFPCWEPCTVDQEMQLFVYNSQSEDCKRYVDAACAPAF